MKISGVLTVRNGEKFDYPYIQSAESILPICDEFVFCEGHSEDDTMLYINELTIKHPGKIKVVHYDWSAKHYTDIPLSTNVGIEACTGDYYINLQADEAIHEKYLDTIVRALESGSDLYRTPILHFWSSYNKVYKPGVFYDEVYRIARRDKYPDIESIWDGMTLGNVRNSQPSNIGNIDAKFLHYGYVRKPQALLEKAAHIFPWWGYDLDPRFHDRSKGDTLNWEAFHPELELTGYLETHPAVMQKWIAEREKAVESGTLS